MRITVFVLSVLLAASLCRAIPTGLNIMPTAEVLPSELVRVDYESSGSGKLFVPTGESVIGAQAGTFFGLETGFDTVSGKGTVYNVKWRLPGTGRPALAIGAQNIASEGVPQYYLVATRRLGRVAVSGGLITDGGGDDDLLGMAGASLRWASAIVRVDHVQGEHARRSAAGVGFATNRAALLLTAYDIAHEANTITLTFSIRYDR